MIFSFVKIQSIKAGRDCLLFYILKRCFEIKKAMIKWVYGDGLMKIVHDLEFQTGSKEEKLPYDNPEFPYLASQAELDFYREPYVPWHWHEAIELFYIESGTLKYYTPNHTEIFTKGMAGMVNSNVLHMTKIQTHQEKNIQRLHIFDPKLISGGRGNRIDQKYILPLTTAFQIELITLTPERIEHRAIIDQIKNAFLLSEDDFGYEIKIRETLSQIWLALFQLCEPVLQERTSANLATDKLKLMMVYIHEHYFEKIMIPELSKIAFLSERECYRVFKKYLHMTPAEYIKSYRIQSACQMLVETKMTITEIGHLCGLGNTSYFGQTFREITGVTPLEYRRIWQDNDKKWQD